MISAELLCRLWTASRKFLGVFFLGFVISVGFLFILYSTYLLIKVHVDLTSFVLCYIKIDV